MPAVESIPRVVVVSRLSDYEALLVRHGTRDQARFFLETRGQRIEEVEKRHHLMEEARVAVSQAIPVKWRRSRVDRVDLSRFVFEPEDIVVAVGQDGLVANVAKYLGGQAVLGINPDPASYDGVLVPHPPDAAHRLLMLAARGRARTQSRTMIEAVFDDGQRVLALNEVFLGHRSHQSARYRVRVGDREERQSSSGIVVATGTGATGWARSICLQRRKAIKLPAPSERRVALFVREAFPSVCTGAKLCEATLGPDQEAEVVSEMNEGGVVFGDGIEDDRLDFGWGIRARVRIAAETLRLIV